MSAVPSPLSSDARLDAKTRRERVPVLERRGGSTLLGAIGVVVALGLWELVTRAEIVDSRDFPPASDVIGEFASMLFTQALWTDFGHTLTGWGIGLGIAVAIGVPLGILMGRSAIAWHALRPTVEFLRPVPGVALIPLAILLWGQSTTSAAALVALGCVWHMLIQTMYGARGVDEVAIQTARLFGLSRFDRLRFVILPSSLPYIATGLRVCAAIALMIGVTAELVINTPGLGQQIVLAQSAGQVTKMYALIFATGVLGIAIHLAFTALERRPLRWHESQRAKAAS